jgi:hypothetical protein
MHFLDDKFSKLKVAAASVFHMLEIPGSNLGSDIGYFDSGFSQFSLVPAGKC